jgi:hypothetical protein
MHSTHGAKIKTHGMSRTPTYKSWLGMMQRCNGRSGDMNFKNYGGRGIRVCRRWRNIKLFIKDMGTRPSLNHSIERKDNDGNYDPKNCCWATRKEQIRNRRCTVMVKCAEFCGSAAEAAEIMGVRLGLIYDRKKLGWTDSKIFTTKTKA